MLPQVPVRAQSDTLDAVQCISEGERQEQPNQPLPNNHTDPWLPESTLDVESTHTVEHKPTNSAGII